MDAQGNSGLNRLTCASRASWDEQKGLCLVDSPARGCAGQRVMG